MPSLPNNVGDAFMYLFLFMQECTAPECSAVKIKLQESEAENSSLKIRIDEQREALEKSEAENSSLKTAVAEQEEAIKKLTKRDGTLIDMQAKMSTLCEGELEPFHFFSVSLPIENCKSQWRALFHYI